MINLTKRLAAVASFAEDGRRIADIGTDHGYIPIYLMQLGRAEKIVASDIGLGPIERARISAREYGLEEKLTFVTADGLSGIDDSFDTVIIAGMGGDNIISILSEGSWALTKAHLVLQPQSRVQKLVRWLYNNGCTVSDACLVRDFGRMYIVLSVNRAEGKKNVSGAEALVPLPLFTGRDPLLREYLEEQIGKFAVMVDGIESGKTDEFSEKLHDAKDTLEGLKAMLSEAKKW